MKSMGRYADFHHYPSFNSGDLIECAITSVAEQDYPH
jgi:hypothetical protein